MTVSDCSLSGATSLPNRQHDTAPARRRNRSASASARDRIAETSVDDRPCQSPRRPTRRRVLRRGTRSTPARNTVAPGERRVHEVAGDALSGCDCSLPTRARASARETTVGCAWRGCTLRHALPPQRATHRDRTRLSLHRRRVRRTYELGLRGRALWQLLRGRPRSAHAEPGRPSTPVAPATNTRHRNPPSGDLISDNSIRDSPGQPSRRRHLGSRPDRLRPQWSR